MEINIEGSKEKRRLKKKWLDEIKSDMKTAGVCICEKLSQMEF